MAIHLPTPKQIRDLLLDLLDREIDLVTATPFAPGPSAPGSIAVYVDDQLMIRALAVADLPFSAYAGGAIGLVPSTAADAAVTGGALTEVLAENLYEVFNIACGLFNVAGADHVRLHELHPAGAPMPQHLWAHALTLGRREDVAVDIGGYGKGRLGIILIG